MVARLELSEVSRRLQAQEIFSKDLLLSDNWWRIPDNKHRNRDHRIERAMLWALMGPGSSAAEQAQAVRQATCTPANPCREIMCWLCKHLAWLKLRRELAAVLDHDMDDDQISFVTIVLGVSEPSRKALRKLMFSFRSWLRFAADAWEVVFFGRFEVDLVLDPLVNTTAFKRKTLRPLGLDPDSDGPVAVFHVHLIAYHPGLDGGLLAFRLKRCISGLRRTEVRPLHSDQSQTEALDHLTRYMLKSLPPKDALFGRGSRLCLPRDPEALRLHNRLVRFLAGEKGQCIARPKVDPENL
jgi:hypothetical protein